MATHAMPGPLQNAKPLMSDTGAMPLYMLCNCSFAWRGPQMLYKVADSEHDWLGKDQENIPQTDSM